MTRRTCGECRLCCKVMAVQSIDKPAGKWCRHCDTKCVGGACKIYEDRPQQCADFECLWLQRDAVPLHMYPRISRCVLITNDSGTGMTAMVDPAMPNAWRKPDVLSYLMHVAKQLVVVVDTGTRAYQIGERGWRELRSDQIRRHGNRSDFLVEPPSVDVLKSMRA